MVVHTTLEQRKKDGCELNFLLVYVLYLPELSNIVSFPISVPYVFIYIGKKENLFRNRCDSVTLIFMFILYCIVIIWKL